MRIRLSAAIAAFLLVCGVAFALIGGSSGSKRETLAERNGDRYAKYRDDPRKEAAFENERGGEADRKGPQNPVVEQVDNRAYPRGYVDDRLALKARKAFDAKPSRARAARARAARAHTARARRLARASISAAWQPLGPVTPNVSGEASQFYDVASGTGPATQESGRARRWRSTPTATRAPVACGWRPPVAGSGAPRTRSTPSPIGPRSTTA